jgi:hypothetical protein
MDPIYSTQAALANAALLTVVPVTKPTHATTTEQHAATEAVAAVNIVEDTMPVAEAAAVEIAEPVVTAPKKASKKTTKKKTTSTEA